MNLYFVFALALGALSGTATMSPTAPAVTNVIAERAEYVAARGAVSSVETAENRLKPVLHARPRTAAVAEVPLTGAATPRAPAAD